MTADPKELCAKVLDAGLASYQRRKHIEELTVLDATSDEIHATLVALLADDDSYIQREAIKAIAKRHHPRAAIDLIGFLEAGMGKDEYVQRDAVEFLEKRADPRARKVLEKLSGSSSFTLAYAAKRALEALAKAAPTPKTEPLSAPKPESAADVLVPKPEQTPSAERAPASRQPGMAAVYEREPKKTPRPAEPTVPLTFASVSPPSYPTSPTRTTPAFETATLPDRVRDTPTAQPPLDWDRMPRLAAFFDGHWDEVKTWYAEKIQAERELVPMEKEHLETIVAIERRRADKDDDIAACRTSIEEHETRIEALQNGVRRKTREREMREADANGIWWIIKAFFLSSVLRNFKEDVKRLNKEIYDDGQEKEKLQEALPGLREALAALTGPLDELIAKSVNLKKEMRARRKTIVTMHGRIRKRVFRIVCGTLDLELRRRLEPLTRRPGADPFLRTCIDEIQDVALTLKGLDLKLKKHRAATGQCGARCAEAADALGQEFREGFTRESSSRDAQIRISGSLRFQEESSFFGGYGNAQGSAQGQGLATARYTVEEIDWRPTPALGEVVTAYHKTWEELGNRLAGEALLNARRAAAQRTVADYVAYLRSELERDLREDDDA